MRRGLITLGVLIAFVASFYIVENIRGKRAWSRCKAELEAKGVVLEWNAFIPPPVPDDQNFFKAPKMHEWFLGRGDTEITRRLDADKFLESVLDRSPPLAQVTLVSLDMKIAPAKADLILEYRNQGLVRPPPPREDLAAVPELNPEVIPLIRMDDVLLTDAIENLARIGSLKYTIDTNFAFLIFEEHELRPFPQPAVSLVWSNFTAIQALASLLKEFNLQAVKIPETGAVHISARDPSRPQVFAVSSKGEFAREPMLDAVVPAMTEARKSGLRNATGEFRLVSAPPPAAKPAHIVVQTDERPEPCLITKIFPELADVLKIEGAGSNVFRLRLNPPVFATARDYLNWSDAFETDFDRVREAVKRPYARQDGDYRSPVTLPNLNFITVRTIVQRLADRANAHLLLGEPDKALCELTLIRDLCRLLEKRPTTLLSAMINTAVTGLYAETIGDGLRLRAWREPQLAVIQRQLADINLTQSVIAGFHYDELISCRTLETLTAANPIKSIGRTFRHSEGPLSFEGRVREMSFDLGPRGWIYQNMVCNARLIQHSVDVMDATQQVFFPARQKAANGAFESACDHFSPYTYLAAALTPNLAKATQVTARNQTRVHQAFIACALERYRLARGNYPDTLEALVPQYIDKLPHDVIGGQPLKYRCIDNRKFLLYSIGWNEKDDGGTVALNNEHREDLESGDWVWQASPK